MKRGGRMPETRRRLDGLENSARMVCILSDSGCGTISRETWIDLGRRGEE
jgi:hypothetical protein